MGDVLDFTDNSDLHFYKDLAQRNIQASKNRILTYTHKAYFHVFEFDETFKLEAIHKVKNTVEYDPKSIRFYNGEIYILLEKELVVLSFPNSDFSSSKLTKSVYKTKAIYSDFAINFNGVFLFLK